jgi:hypothetical protein
LCFRIFFRRFFTTELIGVPPLDQGAGTELFARPSKGTLLAHPYIPIGGAVRGTAVSITGTPALGETV